MLLWIAENIATIIVGAAVLAVAVLIMIKIAHDKKKGKSAGCGYSCEGCPGSEYCNPQGGK